MRKNAKLNRNALRGLLAALALGGFQVAHAGYAQLAPPAGFSTSSGGFTYAAAANDRVYGKVIHQAGALTANVGGQSVKMPAAYRLAANAPRIAAAVIYLHPGVRTAAGIAAWLGASALVYNATKGLWEVPQEGLDPSTGSLYRTRGSIAWFSTREQACEHLYQSVLGGAPNRTPGAIYETNPSCKFYYMVPVGVQATPIRSYVDSTYETKNDVCPAGTYSTPAGCSPVAPPSRLLKYSPPSLLS